MIPPTSFLICPSADLHGIESFVYTLVHSRGEHESRGSACLKTTEDAKSLELHKQAFPRRSSSHFPTRPLRQFWTVG